MDGPQAAECGRGGRLGRCPQVTSPTALEAPNAGHSWWRTPKENWRRFTRGKPGPFQSAEAFIPANAGVQGGAQRAGWRGVAGTARRHVSGCPWQGRAGHGGYAGIKCGLQKECA